MTLLGTVLARDGAVYRVATEEGELEAVLRGKTKRGSPKVVVGDVVHLESEAGGSLFAIHGVEPRKSVLSRRVPEGRGERPVAANIDQVAVMVATRDPIPIPQLVDRLLVIAEANQLAPLLVVNKIDLAPGTSLITRYREVGYDVFPTSSNTGEGIESFRERLHGRVSVVTGPSGVGKSSLLNAVQPGLRLRVGAISSKARRGRHTTVSAVMIPLGDGGYVVDTPGFSEVGLWGLEPRQLAACFPEMAELHGRCRYADCLHEHEPDCVVQNAARAGEIDPDRHASYLALLQELRSAPKAWE